MSTTQVSASLISQTFSPKLTATTNYYVATTGNDTNPGTIGSPFLTIQKAITTLQGFDFNFQTVNINVSDGTYTGTVSLQAPTINGIINLIGNTTTPANCIISTTSANAVSVGGGATLNISGFKIQTTTSGAAINLGATNGSPGYLNINGSMNFGVTPLLHMNITGGSVLSVNSNYTISGSSGYHIAINDAGSKIFCTGKTVTITGSPTFSNFFILCYMLAFARMDSMTYSGAVTATTKYSVQYNALIQTNGTTTFPGATGGTTSTGGIFN